MANKNFNIDETNYNKFKDLHAGDMSKIVNEFIANCISDVNAKPVEVAKLELELKQIDKQILELKNKSYSISVRIANKHEMAKKQIQAKTQEELDIDIWANETISDHKTHGTYTGLVLEAEKAGLTPHAFLVKQWKEAKK